MHRRYTRGWLKGFPNRCPGVVSTTTKKFRGRAVVTEDEKPSAILGSGCQADPGLGAKQRVSQEEGRGGVWGYMWVSGGVRGCLGVL